MASNRTMNSLSVVIPLYNEEQTLPALWERLSAVLASLPLRSEVIFVNDGSSDGTLAALHRLCDQHRQVKLLSLSRNFGHGAALSAGIHHAHGDAVVLMDGDLQDRPEVIPEFLARLREGHDVAYAIRTSRQESLVSRVAFKSFYKLLGRMSSIRQPLDAGIFGAATRRVMDAVRAMPEHNRYFPGLRAFAGYRQVGVNVDRDARQAGNTRVGIKGLVRLAMDALFSFSYVPIRLVTWLGTAVVALSLLYMSVVLYKRLISLTAITGWSSTLCVILLLGGTQMIILGVLGEYISRIYDESKRRPIFLVQETRNLDAPRPKTRPGKSAKRPGIRPPRP